MRLATPVIEDLAQHTGHTAALALWGSHGPTIVRQCRRGITSDRPAQAMRQAGASVSARLGHRPTR